jgi:hypothetical protein
MESSCEYIEYTQWRIADGGGPPPWGLGVVAKNPHSKKVTKCSMELPTWKVSLARSKHRKMGMRFGTWNVRSLYWTGSL